MPHDRVSSVLHANRAPSSINDDGNGNGPCLRHRPDPAARLGDVRDLPPGERGRPFTASFGLLQNLDQPIKGLHREGGHFSGAPTVQAGRLASSAGDHPSELQGHDGRKG
eukprot:863120-Alexandrium_andersonii.AAC.1